jgi:hypothetical protein
MPPRQHAKKLKTKETAGEAGGGLPRIPERDDGADGNGEDDCHCEVDRLTVATTNQPEVVVNPNTGLTNVLRNAWFIAYFRNDGCCDCCEFRQYVRGYLELNGVAIAPPVPGFNLFLWNEDQDSAGMNYGHRTQPAEDGNRYVPDQANGCIYVGRDAPGIYGLSSGDDYFIYYEFVDVIIDTCNDDEVVAGPERWDMIAAGTVA